MTGATGPASRAPRRRAGTRAFVLLLLLAAVAAPARAGEDLDSLVAALGDRAKRAAAFGELRRRRDPRVVPLLVKALPGLDATGQSWGSILISEAGGPDALPAFRRLAMSESPWLRVEAGFYAFRLGDPGGALALADGLLAGGVDASLRIRMLGRARSVPAAPVRTAIGALLGRDEGAAVHSYALFVLDGLGAEREADAVEGLLGAPDPGLRALAAAVLLRVGREEHAESLAAAIEQGKIGAAEWARIDGVLAACPRVPKPVLAAMAERLGAAREEAEVLRLLGHLERRPYPPARGALEARLADRRRDVVLAAFDALLALPGALPPERLLPLLEGRPDFLRLRAADALRRLDDRSGFPTAVAVLAAGAAEDRAEAAAVLARFVVAGAVDPLLAALLDPAPAVRAAAFGALADLLPALLPYRRLNLARTRYDPRATPEANAAPVETLRAWWSTARSRDW